VNLLRGTRSSLQLASSLKLPCCILFQYFEGITPVGMERAMFLPTPKRTGASSRKKISESWTASKPFLSQPKDGKSRDAQRLDLHLLLNAGITYIKANLFHYLPSWGCWGYRAEQYQLDLFERV